MRADFLSVKFCRNCDFFSPQGSRYGMCSKLKVTVENNWIACYLCLPAFYQK